MPVVNQSRTIFDATNDGGFVPYFPTGVQFYSGQGWHANQNNTGNNFTTLQLSKGSVGLLANEKIQSVTLNFSIPGSIGWQGSGAVLSQNPNNAAQSGAIQQDGWQQTVALDSGNFGEDVPLSIIAGSQNIAAAGLYLTHVTLNLLVDTSLPNTPPPPQGCTEELQGNVDVAITYTAGYGPSGMQIGDTIKVVSEDIIPYNRIDLTFAGPVDISITCVQNWQVTPLKINPYIIFESPVGKVVNSFGQDKYSDPTQIAISQLVTHLRIYNDWPGQQFTVYIKLIKIHAGDTTTDVGSGQNFGPITDGLDGIKQAINDESTNVGAIIENGINNAIQNITGIPGDIVAGILKGIPDIVNAIVAQLITDFKTITFGGSQLEQDITNTIQNIVTTEGSNGFNFLKIFLQKFIEQEAAQLSYSAGQVNDVTSSLDAVLNTLLQGNYPNYAAFEKDLRANVSTATWLLTLQNIVTVFASVLLFVKAKTDIANIVTRQLLLSEYTPNINDLNTLVRAYFRHLIDYNQLTDYASKYGLDSTSLEQLVLANRNLPGVNEIKEMYLRGYISKAQHDNYLSQYGFAGPDIDLITQNYTIVPPYTDLIRMGDKHVFDTKIPTYFGQFAELPQQLTDAMKAWGVNDKWTRNIWGAHWSMPEPRMLFDMYHRGIINYNDLQSGLQYTDMLPFFRDRMTDLSFQLINRVDIRRMYSIGIYSADQVKQAYIKLGYSPSDSEDLMRFTVENEKIAEEGGKKHVRELTQSMITEALKDGIINTEVAQQKLQDLGYSAADAQIIITMEQAIINTKKIDKKIQEYHDKVVNLVLTSFTDGVLSESETRNYLVALGVPQSSIDADMIYSQIDRIVKLKKILIGEIEKAYKQGQISKTDATNKLLADGFAMSEITLFFEEFDLVLSIRNKPLTETQLKDLFKAGVITEIELAQELANLGYSDQHIAWLTQMITGVV